MISVIRKALLNQACDTMKLKARKAGIEYRWRSFVLWRTFRENPVIKLYNTPTIVLFSRWETSGNQRTVRPLFWMTLSLLAGLDNV